MSLIYSALNNLEQVPGAQGAPEKTVAHPYVAAARKTGLPPWVYLAVSGCVLVVLAGVLSMTVLRERFAALQTNASGKPASPAPASAASPAPQGTVALQPVSVVPPDDLPVSAKTDAPVMVAQPGPPPVTAQIAPPPVVPAAAPMEVAAKTHESAANALPAADQKELDSRIEMMVEAPKANAKTRPAKTARSKSHALPQTDARVALLAAPERVPAAPAANEINPEETDRLTLAIKGAIQAGKNDEAESLLEQLGTRLLPESITLLHLRAWQKMQSGDQAQAISLYRHIVGRIPDDETATINLALLYWKAGQQDEARSLVGTLAERHSESETVQRYSRQFGALR